MVSCKLRHLLAALVSALMFCAASSGIIMLNKWIISVLGFKFPMTLSLIGMLFSFACSATLACTTPWVKRTVELTPRFMLLRAAPIGVLTALTLYFGNLAYVTLSVSFLQMLKASTPLIVLVLMFVARLETPNLSMIGSVLVIAAGTLVAAKGEVRFVWSGVLAMTASQFTEASKLVLMQLLIQGIKLGPLEGLLCFSPFASLALAIGVVTLELDGLRAGGFALMAEHPFLFLGQAALGFCVNLLTILTVKLTSSISFKLISMAKNAAIVLISVPIFHNKISPTQAR